MTVARAYDVLPQAHSATDGRMALAVNGNDRHHETAGDDLFAEFAARALRRAARTVTVRLDELGAILREEEPLDGAFPRLDVQLQAFVDILSSGSPVGASLGRTMPRGSRQASCTSGTRITDGPRRGLQDP